MTHKSYGEKLSTAGVTQGNLGLSLPPNSLDNILLNFQYGCRTVLPLVYHRKNKKN